MSKRSGTRRGWLDRISGVRAVLDGAALVRAAMAFIFAACVFTWSHIRHYWGPWALVASLATFAVVLELCVRLPDVVRRTVKVKLEPASGPAEIQLLNVKNCGREQAFRAECTLLERRNDHNELHRFTFRLGWEGPNKRAVRLRGGGSCNLVIAMAGEKREPDQNPPSDFQWLEILGLSDESAEEMKQRSVWRRADLSPEYDLEIRIIGDIGQKPHVQRFTLKPGDVSAMRMLEL
jgi:hypothetical protein